VENSKITKEKAEELMNLSGRARGVVLQTDAEYVRQKKGEGALNKVKEEFEKLGVSINYENIKATNWYPIGLRAISLLAIKKVFNWTDKEIENMGNTAPKYSFVVKALVKYFVTFERSYKESPKYWEKHYLAGELETADYNLKKKYYTIRLKNFKIHPILCIYLGGYFIRMGQLILKGENFRVKETKCQFSGDPYHEFLVEWD